MSNTATKLEQKIALKDDKIQQLLNEKKQLIQRQKIEERKARTHRLCKRHGLLEQAMPALITLTDEQFEDFIRRGINTSYGQKILTEILSKAGASISAAHTEATYAESISGGANPPKAEQQGA